MNCGYIMMQHKRFTYKLVQLIFQPNATTGHSSYVRPEVELVTLETNSGILPDLIHVGQVPVQAIQHGTTHVLEPLEVSV